ncbi:hypothetical protein [Stutzerimonas kunmingensis]|uniref:PglD N-terminal domain-containing protein n=1 Tax=Stutzerimonas kunmingensis TaxID=1211807 RepID=A0A9X1N5S4_9GAMM|nr:hypothetical protein [Stutzerimonas kunmingensis]
MSKSTLLIIGAGGHGKAVAEAALLSGEWQRIAFADDRWPALRETFGWPVVADVAGLAASKVTLAGVLRLAIMPCAHGGSRPFVPPGCPW